MPLLTDISPEILRLHHQLSPQQINALFGKTIVQESFEEKAVKIIKVAEFIRVTDAFRRDDIKFISLKGPLLSKRLYDDPTWRQYHDLDILVDITAVSQSVKLLTELGYSPVGHTWPNNQTGQRLIVNHVHHLSFEHPQHDLLVELHWRLFQSHSARSGIIEELVNENQTNLHFEQRSFRVLSNELELLYLAMHGSIHYFRRLKWLVDLNEILMTQNINWELFNNLAHKLHADRLVTLANAVLSVYFPKNPLMQYEGKVKPFMRNFSLRQIAGIDKSGKERIIDKIRWWRFSLASYPDNWYRVRRFWNFLMFYTYQFFRRKEHYHSEA